VAEPNSDHHLRTFRDRVTDSLYLELKNVAMARLRLERPNHTLQPTELVHEVCLRLLRSEVRSEDREHLIRTAAHCMRHVLVDYARSKEAQKRGSNNPMISLDEGMPVLPEWRSLSPEEVIDLDKALTKLQTFDERQALVVELRFFAGLNEEEIAVMLKVSTRTVKRDWEMSRAWLQGQLHSRQGVRRRDE
jgi:RNA polymerase sigma-70 factor (ECF subfamily)